MRFYVGFIRWFYGRFVTASLSLSIDHSFWWFIIIFSCVLFVFELDSGKWERCFISTTHVSIILFRSSFSFASLAEQWTYPFYLTKQSTCACKFRKSILFSFSFQLFLIPIMFRSHSQHIHIYITYSHIYFKFIPYFYLKYACCTSIISNELLDLLMNLYYTFWIRKTVV